LYKNASAPILNAGTILKTTYHH